MGKDAVNDFVAAFEKVGGRAVFPADLEAAAAYLAQHSGGPLLLPPSPSLLRCDFAARLNAAGCQVIARDFRAAAPSAAAGVTGVNFAIAATGTLLLDSTAEALRLATTLPERHFALLDPRKIVADSTAAVPLLRRLHQQLPQAFLACLTGPSRTADIERVLTIGVHGPRELHVLICSGLSDDILES